MNAIDELRAYASLLEHSTKIPPVVGLRLGELANEIAKDMQQASQKTPDGARSKRVWVASDETSPVNPAPTPEAVLLKEMADWWNRIKSAHAASQLVYDELRDLTRRAFNIVNS